MVQCTRLDVKCCCFIRQKVTVILICAILLHYLSIYHYYYYKRKFGIVITRACFTNEEKSHLYELHVIIKREKKKKKEKERFPSILTRQWIPPLKVSTRGFYNEARITQSPTPTLLKPALLGSSRKEGFTKP